MRLHKNEYSGEYPDKRFDIYREYGESEKLLETVSKYTGVSVENIILDFGAVALIERVISFYYWKEYYIPQKVWHTYKSILQDSHSNISFYEAPTENKDEMKFFQNVIFKSEVKSRYDNVTIIVSPSNPDGSFLQQQEVIDVCKMNSLSWILLDATYHDYSFEPYDFKLLLEQCNNLSIFWSLSKSFGLAGARIGALFSTVFRKEILGEPRLGLNTSACEIAILAMTSYKDFFEKQRALIVYEREEFSMRVNRKLQKMSAYRSEANFFLLKSDVFDMRELQSWLSKIGVLVRWFEDWGEFLRITVGSRFEMNVLFEKLEEVDNGKIYIPERNK